VLWVDEAGQVGSQDMNRLFDLAKREGARVILTGDTRQHGSVNRGDALYCLETHSGLRVASLTHIVRQKGSYKDAVDSLSRGKIAEGFDRLDKLGWVREMPDKGAREQALAADYVSALREGRTVLAVAPTHAEGRSITRAIRAELEAAGRLGKEERTLPQLVPAQPTEAERKDSAYYTPGMVVEFHLPAKGFRSGARCRVEGVDDQGKVAVRTADGKACTLPLEHAARFQVFTGAELSLKQGDRLRIGKNGRTADGRHALNRGTVYEVAGFTKDGGVKLGNGWELPRDFCHYGHGYCLTSFAAQGKTVDRVLVAESSESFPASSREQFYVSASRARESVTVYTDDKAELKRNVQDSSKRLSASELLPRSAEVANLWQKQAERLQRLAETARAYASQKVADISAQAARMRGRGIEREG
jgi:hypothetical protein